ncbi:hypothetical protein ACLOJK_019578, partial [Asimina triloba]
SSFKDRKDTIFIKFSGKSRLQQDLEFLKDEFKKVIKFQISSGPRHLGGKTKGHLNE